jgi:hypothetical protein
LGAAPRFHPPPSRARRPHLLSASAAGLAALSAGAAAGGGIVAVSVGPLGAGGGGVAAGLRTGSAGAAGGVAPGNVIPCDPDCAGCGADAAPEGLIGDCAELAAEKISSAAAAIPLNRCFMR